ncbi:MAG: PAS domain S-box protein [Anaerolineae bacterium]|nr:PAS domain S-box protein [Gemmatimonadaceae bacterium]
MNLRSALSGKRPIWLLAAIPGCVLLLAAGWLRARSVHHSRLALREQVLTGNVNVTRNAVEAWLGERTLDGKILAANAATLSDGIAYERGSTPSQRYELALARLIRTLNATEESFKYDAVWAFDTVGTVVAQGNRSSAPSQRERALAAEVFRAGEPRILDAYLDTPGRVTLTVMVPVTGDTATDQPIAGAIGLRVNASSQLFPLVAWHHVNGTTVENGIVARSGNRLVILTPTPHADSLFGNSFSSDRAPAIAWDAATGIERAGASTNTHGQAVTASGVHIAGTGWGLVRQIDRNEALAPANAQLRTEGLLVLALLSAGTLAYLMTRRTRRRDNLRSLALSEARLSGIIGAALDCIVTMDHLGNVTEFNPAAEQTFGYSREQAIGKQMVELIVPERFRDAHRKGVARFLETTQSRIMGKRMEISGLRADGSEFPVELAIVRIPGYGAPSFAGYLRDLTKPRLAEQEMARQKKFYERIIEDIDTDIAVLDGEGRYEYVSPSAVRDPAVRQWLIGRTDEEYCQKRDRDPALARMRARSINSVFSTGQAIAFEERHENVSRETRYVIRKLCPMLGDDGKVAKVIGYGFDITDRKIAEEALRLSEASSRSFVEHSPYGIYRSSMEGSFIAVNTALVMMLGYESEKDLLAVRLISDVYQNPAERARLIAEEQLRPRREPGEVVWKRKNGAPITVRIWARSILDSTGKLQCLEGFVEDISAWRDAERALQQAEKLAAIGQLISGVAHELNNPLSAILHFAEDLERDERPANDMEALGIIRAQAERSRTIVRDLLATSRGRADARERIDGREAIARAASAVRPRIADIGALLQVDTGSQEVPIEIDLAGVEQVVTNLLVNAAQASGNGGSVIIRVRKRNQLCEITVDDSGPGIPATIMSRIFEPFFTTKPTGTGTGLGLSVSLGIVEQHGGSLRATNRPAIEGGGARFIVTLPCVNGTNVPGATADSVVMPEVESTPNGYTPVNESTSDKPRVLIIEDEPAIRAALRRFFGRRGWDFDEAADGAVGGEFLFSNPGREYAVVFSDLRMPGYSGIQLHDRLLVERPDLLQRVIFSTGDVRSPEAAQFVARTKCLVLEKPFSLKVLGEAVDRLIEEALVVSL